MRTASKCVQGYLSAASTEFKMGRKIPNVEFQKVDDLKPSQV
mgnify:CR=1 FL=1